MAKCVCALMNESSGSSSEGSLLGILKLSQATEDSPTIIEGTLKGLTVGKHGISVCTYGDLSDGGNSCGPIFNPFGKLHGSPQDIPQNQRMVGDLGNLVVVGKNQEEAKEGGGGDEDAAALEAAAAAAATTTTTLQSNGTCAVKISDPLVKLIGPHSIIGRSLVIYAGEDDGGRGGQENSLKTGNAGPRIASGVVGISK